MPSRLAARAIMGPVAFFVAGLVDLMLFALGSVRQRYSRRRGNPWRS
jgi:hypothetical protein